MIKTIKTIIDDKSGAVYTIEAIIGVILIIGAVMFMSNIMPYTAQKTGEHSKVQLVNVGRDVLDLIELTPITDIFSNYSQAQGVNRTYTLVANKTFVRPGEPINFTVYYLDSDNIVTETLTLEHTVLGLNQRTNLTTITGTRIWSFPLVGEYNIRAIDTFSNPTKWSNSVTIVVGYYFLETDVNGIYDSGDKNVNGIVYDTNGSGVSNLSIRILDYKYDCYPNSTCPAFAKTNYGRIIEDFEDVNGWLNSSGNNLTLNNTMKTEGNFSLSINLSGNGGGFWIRKTNNTGYKLFEYDNISLDIFASESDQIDIELSKNNTSNKFIWTNINLQNNSWNKINIQLRYPDIIIGNMAVQDIDTINISVSGLGGSGNGNRYYFFDNLAANAGSFSFIWPNASAGTYYIQAIDSNGSLSNRHRIIYSGNNPDDLGVICCDAVIYETDSINITLFPSGPNKKFQQNNNFNINQIFYNQYDKSKIVLSDPISPNNTVVTLTAYTAGDYYIFYGNTAQGGGQGDPAKAAKTNSILIRVLPLRSVCLFSDCKPKCSGLSMEDLNLYMRLFVPPNINYNLYLINPDGTLCKDCPDFKEITNGYPTDEAVTVNKIFRFKTVSTEYMRELRMILWYK